MALDGRPSLRHPAGLQIPAKFRIRKTASLVAAMRVEVTPPAPANRRPESERSRPAGGTLLTRWVDGLRLADRLPTGRRQPSLQGRTCGVSDRLSPSTRLWQQSVRGQVRSYIAALACIRMLIMRNVAFTAAIT